jgi:hypothetical protein
VLALSFSSLDSAPGPPQAFLLQSLRVFSGLLMPGLCLLSTLLITCWSWVSVLLGFELAALHVVVVDEDAPAIAHVTSGAWVLVHPLSDWRRQRVSLGLGGRLFSTEQRWRRAVVSKLSAFVNEMVTKCQSSSHQPSTLV